MKLTRFKNLHPDHLRILSGASRVAFFLLLAKFAGAIKEVAVAHRYGISEVVDAYQFTMTMANWLPLTIVGAFSVVLIPVLVKTKYLNFSEKKLFIQELQGWVVVLGIVIGALTWVLWPYVLQYAGGRLSLNTRDYSTELLIAFVPAALFTLTNGISTARLRSHERHVNNLLDSLPALMILFFIVIMPGDVSVAPLLWGTLVGYTVQASWAWYLSAKADKGLWGIPRFTVKSDQWGLLFQAAGIMLIGQIASSFVNPMDQAFAAHLGGNANATIGYANRLLSLVLGLGAASIGRAALPVLADIHAQGDAARARLMAIKWSIGMLIGGTAIVVVGWFLAPFGIKYLFQYGAFTAQDTVAVTSVLRWGLLQLPFYFGVLILVQLMASQRRYVLMTSIAVANFGMKAVMNWFLTPIMGTAGIMLATACMYALSYICYVLVTFRYQPNNHIDDKNNAGSKQ